MTNPVRRDLGERVHRLIDRRVNEKAAKLVAQALDEHRAGLLLEHQLYGPGERLRIHPSAKVNDALFNTVSGEIVVEADAFFGHGVAVLTGTHDIARRGRDRQDAIAPAGRDVVIGAGAWVSSRATVIGPCVIGRDAVVAAGAVVVDDVPAETVVAGVPARVVRRLTTGIPAANDLETNVGRMFLPVDDRVSATQDVSSLAELLSSGQVVVDVGAGVGLGTLAAAAAVGAEGAVFALESSPEKLALLRANVARHGAAQVTIVPASNGIDDVVPPEREVALIRLDLDAAHEVLPSANGVLERCRPMLLARFSPAALLLRGVDPMAVLRQFGALGYERSVLDAPVLDGVSDEDLTQRVHAGAPAGGSVTLLLRPSA